MIEHGSDGGDRGFEQAGRGPFELAQSVVEWSGMQQKRFGKRDQIGR
jgi:hypothetical protein